MLRRAVLIAGYAAFDAVPENKRYSANTRVIASSVSETRDNLGYIESNLLPDEEIVYKANLHWKIFWKSSLIVLLGVFCLAIHAILAGAVTGIGLALALRAFIEYQTSEFGVTTKRVIIKTGFLRRRTLELLLRQVEAISVEQGVTGRLFDYGTVILTGTGGVHEVFHNISSPLEFRRRIHGQAT